LKNNANFSVLKKQNTMKQLYFGDCLDVLKELTLKHSEGFIDLIYIDPPFNSKRNYNILFEDIEMKDVKAQREAFADTWSNISYKDSLLEIADLHINLYKYLKNLDEIDVSKSIVAYLTTISFRILYMHKLLKDSGSFYLHCDPTMSHYLKIICDLIFKRENFRNEIIWKRQTAKKGSQFDKRSFGFSNDTIFFYSKSNDYYFNIPLIKLSKSELNKKFNKIDENGKRFRTDNILRNSSLGERPNLVYEYKGFTPGSYGWMVSRDKLKQFDLENRVYWSKNGKPYRKYFIEDYIGKEVSNVWTDVYIAKGIERLGYPTQKPEALLERIIKASSKEGDVVADFFCGCGTSVSVANQLNRNWIGADISHLAIKLILKRLTDSLEENAKREFLNTIEINGFPKDIASAKELATKDKKERIDFQQWVVEFLLGGVLNPKKTADGGWDGYLTFYKNNKEKGIVLIEVKSGNVGVKNIREFIHILNERKADLGVFACFDESVTKQMLETAKEAGPYNPYKFARVQIITIEELLLGKEIRLPGGVDNTTFFKAINNSMPNGNNEELELFENDI